MLELQTVSDVLRVNSSEGLWSNGESEHTLIKDQTELKLCEVKLVDLKTTHTLKSRIITEHFNTGGVLSESSRFDGDTLQAQLKMSSVRLVDYRKATTPGEPEDEAYDEYNSHFLSSNESCGFDEDQQTVHAQLKIAFVRLVDCEKLQSSKAAADGEPEDMTYYQQRNADFICSVPDQSTRFDGDAQIRMSSVRLVDCRKIQKRKSVSEGKPEGETYDEQSKTSNFGPSGKTSRCSPEQHTLEAQLKMCLVRLVDCGRMRSSKATAECDPEDVYGRESTCSNISSSQCILSTSEQEEENTSQEQVIKRKSPRIKFGKCSYTSRHSEKHTALCTGPSQHQCSSFRRSLDFGRPQDVHHCTQCGKEFPQRSQLRRHQSVHGNQKPY